MSEDKDALRSELVSAAKIELANFVMEVLADVQGDLRIYADAIAEDVARFWFRNQSHPDANTARDLSHLRQQAIILAAVHGVIVGRELAETLKKIIETAARVGLAALLAAMK